MGMLTADVLVLPFTQCPERGQLAAVERIALHTGGCAANTGAVLARMGFAVTILGKVGQDRFGDFLLDELQRRGLDVQGVIRDPEVTTSASVVLVSADGERSILHEIGASACYHLHDVRFDLFAGASHLHVGGALLLPGLDGEPLARLLARARAQGLTTSLDTAWDVSGQWLVRLRSALAHTDLFLPSYAEAVALSGLHDPAEAAAYFRTLGPEVVAIKLGEQGCYVQDSSGGTLVPAYKVKVADTTGAGDSFVAGFLAAFLTGWPAREAARLGNAAGALCVQSVGAAGGAGSFAETVAFMQSR